MSVEPYASADRVFWVVDNGSSHRSQASIDRMSETWPTARLVHTPVHASWLNQCEIYFSIVQRKVVTPNDFYDLADVENRLTAFQDLYNLAARPFTPRRTSTRSSPASPPTNRIRRRRSLRDPDELTPRTT
jgi:hypothetical protein